jgi:TetR/AcrR family transcriptional regulator, ethionamide resistance regulator
VVRVREQAGSSRAGTRRGHGRRSSPGTTAAGTGEQDLREAILAATASLLAGRAFADLSVAEILTAAGVSRGTFYFYFDSRYDVLAELVRRAVAQGLGAAEPWLARPADKMAALRQGTMAGARLWQANGPVLRAIVENWRSEPRLTELWQQQMQLFTDATVAQISADPEAMAHLAGQNMAGVASALTWLGERVYYLAACGTPPFDDESVVASTLVHIWASTLYGLPGSVDVPKGGS